MSLKAQAEQLQQNLNNLLAQKATLDEQIIGLRNMIQGVNMGTELQKELDAEEKAKAEAEAAAAAEEAEADAALEALLEMD